MIRDVYLHGTAGRAFGRHFRIDVDSPAEAVRAICMLAPGARDALRVGYWRVIVGPGHVANAIAAEALYMSAGQQPIHIVPAQPAAGGGDGKAVGEIVLGAVLIGASLATGFGAAFLIPMGISMVAGGISGLLTPMPQRPQQQQSPTEQARVEDRPSFLFNGVTNNSQQGGPVPVVMGRHLVGSVVVSAGLYSEDIAI